MSGECPKCGEHALECNCGIGCDPKGTKIEKYSLWPIESIPFPEYQTSPEEASKFMRINVDILKEEITSHIDKELQRFNEELERHRPSNLILLKG